MKPVNKNVKEKNYPTPVRENWAIYHGKHLERSTEDRIARLPRHIEMLEQLIQQILPMEEDLAQNPSLTFNPSFAPLHKNSETGLIVLSQIIIGDMRRLLGNEQTNSEITPIFTSLLQERPFDRIGDLNRLQEDLIKFKNRYLPPTEISESDPAQRPEKTASSKTH